MVDSAGKRLSDRIRTCLEPRKEIQEAYLFGSLATGAAQDHSDVDVAVRLESLGGVTALAYRAELSSVLMQALGSNAVDVVLLNDAPPVLYHRVLRDGIRLLSRDLEATTVREGQALSRYCDFVPHLEKIESAHRARVERGEFGR